MAMNALAQHGVSIALACRTFQLSGKPPAVAV